MERLTLSFPSVFDLHDFRKKVETEHTEARVNHLTGHFSSEQLDIAIKVYNAELIRHVRD